MKLLSKVCIVLICVFSLSNTTYASEVRKGSIRLELEDLDLLVSEDICLCITKVGTIDDGKYVFDSQYLAPDAIMNIETSAIDTNSIIHELISKVKPDKVADYNDSGIWEFDDLEEGIYLVYEKEVYKGISIEPSLITIPYYDEVHNKMQYEVSVFPKYSVLTPTPIPVIVPETGDSNNLDILIAIMSITAVVGIMSVQIMRKYKRV